MATLQRLGPWKHLRAETHEHVLHFRKGKCIREGVGLAYWFDPLSAAIAVVPIEDQETTFLLSERTRDLQSVSVQVTLRFRFTDPHAASRRFPFGISLESGRWMESPLERVSSIWAERAQVPTRRILASLDLEESIRTGAEVIHAAVGEALTEDADLTAMGVEVSSVQVTDVAPANELKKALETPTREAIQQRADEAVFRRRATAVEKERAIQENELATEIELARRQEDLIRRRGENQVHEVELEARAALTRTEAEIDRHRLEAQALAENARVEAEGDAAATRLRNAAVADGEARRVEVWGEATPQVLIGLALQEFAGKIDHIQHLSLTPELFGDGLRKLLLAETER